MTDIGPPAVRPCPTCPYRRDAPSGLWAREMYELLPPFDRETAYQPAHVFMCHTVVTSLCAGWVAVHDPFQTLGLRVALLSGRMSTETMDAVVAYKTDVPVFLSGTQARDHGLRDIDHPGKAAIMAMLKVYRQRQLWPHFECPHCHAITWEPKDVERGWCGECRAVTEQDENTVDMGEST